MRSEYFTLKNTDAWLSKEIRYLEYKATLFAPHEIRNATLVFEIDSCGKIVATEKTDIVIEQKNTQQAYHLYGHFFPRRFNTDKVVAKISIENNDATNLYVRSVDFQFK